MTKQGKSKKAKERKITMVSEQLNLFMERGKNICFETRSARNKSSLQIPVRLTLTERLNLFMGIQSTVQLRKAHLNLYAP